MVRASNEDNNNKSIGGTAAKSGVSSSKHSRENSGQMLN